MARRKKDEVLRTGTVTVEKGGKVYTASYDVLKAGRGDVMVRLQTGQCTHRGGLTEEGLARRLLGEIIDSGLADREGLGRPKAEARGG